MAGGYKENIRRSVTKAIVFRLLIICSDLVIVFVITHRYDLTIGVTFFSNLASTLIYFLYERMWNAVRWGKTEK